MRHAVPGLAPPPPLSPGPCRLPIIWWIGRGVMELVVWGVEKTMFTWHNALYFCYAVRVGSGGVQWRVGCSVLLDQQPALQWPSLHCSPDNLTPAAEADG